MPYDNMEDVRRAGYGYADDPSYYGRGGRDAEGVVALDESPGSISTKNYEVPGREDDQRLFRGLAVGSQYRPGVQADGSQADAALAHTLNNYWKQSQALGEFQNASDGGAPSAAAVGNRMATDNAIAQQYAGGGSGANQYLAGKQGVNAMGAINAQYGGQRAQEIAQANQTEAGFNSGLRGNLQQQMNQSQNWAGQQAQLDAAQLARNDQMARYYTSQGNQLDLDQLSANQAYEAQKGEMALQISQAQDAKTQAERDRYDRRMNGFINGVAGAVTAGIGSSVAQ